MFIIFMKLSDLCYGIYLQEEYDEMIQIAIDPVTDTIPYEYYINQLMVWLNIIL